MGDLEQRKPRLEVDIWDQYRQKLKRDYIAKGMTDDKADDQATADVRREIRGRTP